MFGTRNEVLFALARETEPRGVRMKVAPETPPGLTEALELPGPGTPLEPTLGLGTLGWHWGEAPRGPLVTLRRLARARLATLRGQ